MGRLLSSTKGFLRKVARFEFLLCLLLIISHTIASVSPQATLLKWFTNDDAFFYFTVARNISSGYGITFDRLNPTNGFHPLWMAVCVPIFWLAHLDTWLPLRVLILLLGVLQAATGVLLYRLAARVMNRYIAMLVGLVWTFSPFIHQITAQNGLEAGITAFFLALALNLIADLPTSASPRRIVGIGLACALLFLSRLDMIFLVIILGIGLVFRGQSLRYYLNLDVLAIPFSVLLSFLYLTGLGSIYRSGAFVMIALALVIRLPVFYFWGLYLPPRSLPAVSRLLHVLAAVTVSSLGMAILMLALLQLRLITAFPRSSLVLEWFLSLVSIALIRLLIDWLAIGQPPGHLSPVSILRQNGPGWLRDGASYFGIVGSVVLLYMGWNFLQFGTPTPVSGQIKDWWGLLGDTVYGRPIHEPLALFGLDPRLPKGAWGPALSFLFALVQKGPITVILILGLGYILVGLGLLKIRRTTMIYMVERVGLLPLIVGCFIQIWTYNARGYVPVRSWYWVAELTFTALAAGLILAGFIKLAPWPRFQQLAPVAMFILLGAVVLGSFGGMVRERISSSVSGFDFLEVKAVQFLETATPPGSLIGMTGGGTTSYFLQDRTIINLDGLINSFAYFQALKRFQAADYLASIGLDFVYGNAMILTESIPYQQEFSGHLEPLQSFAGWTLYAFQNKLQP